MNQHYESTEGNKLGFAASSIEIAGDILTAHDKVTDDEIKYSFPYIYYLVSATMVMSELLSRHPSLQRQCDPDLLRRAVASLRTYCYKVWVSGKLMRTVSELDSLVRTVFTDDTRHAQPGRSQRNDQDDREPQSSEKIEWQHSSDAMQDEPEHLSRRTMFPGGVAGSDELHADQPMSLHDLSEHPRFPVSAMADFDFKSMIIGNGGGPVPYTPDNGRRMVMMYGQASADGSGVFPSGHMTGDGALYRPHISQPNFSMRSTMPPGTINPNNTTDGGF